MALINLKTDLKSLKYGRDRVGGGSSNQPYFQKRIPVTSSTNPYSMDGIGITGGYDNLIRGGTLLVSSSGQDASRLTSLLGDLSNYQGPGFVLKQKVLSKQNVRTQYQGTPNQGKYYGLDTIGQAAAAATGAHIPLFRNQENYYDRISNQRNLNASQGENRLYYLYDSKIWQNDSPEAIAAATQQGYTITGGNLLSYRGGPQGGLRGVGQTIIRFADQRTVKVGPQTLASDATLLGDLIAYKNNPIPVEIQDFRKLTTLKNQAPDIKFNRPGIYKTGNPGNRSKNRNTDTGTTDSLYTPDLDTVDQVNFKKLYVAETVTEEAADADLIPFYIGVYNNDTTGPNNEFTYIHFRAFIDQFSDTVNSQWKDRVHMGRGEKFYTYQSADRSINIGFTIHAQTRAELLPQYEKLNYLISSMYADYSKSGIMRGNFVEMTVGSYLTDVPGILTNLTLTIPESTTWDLGRNNAGELVSRNARLPHRMTATMTFTPVYSFIPRRVENINRPGLQPFLSAMKDDVINNEEDNYRTTSTLTGAVEIVASKK